MPVGVLDARDRAALGMARKVSAYTKLETGRVRHLSMALLLALLITLAVLVFAVGLGVVLLRARDKARALDNADMQAIVSFACNVAARAGEKEVDLHHLALGVAGGSDGRARFSTRGLDAGRFTAILRAELPPLRPPPASFAPTIADRARRVVAEANRRSGRVSQADSLLDVLRTRPELSSAFEAATASHGAHDSAQPASPTDVVFRNDPVTKMELVVEIMREVFEMDDLDAMRAMLFVHFAGAGRLGPYTLEDAERRAARGLEIARERGAPLVIEVEPHVEVPVAWGR